MSELSPAATKEADNFQGRARVIPFRTAGAQRKTENPLKFIRVLCRSRPSFHFVFVSRRFSAIAGFAIARLLLLRFVVWNCIGVAVYWFKVVF